MPVPVEERTTVWPLTRLLLASRSVTVMVEVDDPSAVMPEFGLAEIEEFPATGEPAVKLTVPSALLTGEVMVSVFVSALVELNVQVETPEPFELLQAP